MSFLPPWFRIHLSTALVLMIAASAMLGMNLVKQRDYYLTASFGWPMVCLDYHSGVPGRYVWHFQHLGTDIVTAVVLLFAIGIVLEKRIAILSRMKD